MQFRKIAFLFLLMSFSATVFSQSTLIPYRKGDLWGYAGPDGKIVIQPRFQQSSFFREDGLALVKVKDKFGYIGRDGTIKISPQYDSATDFSMGIATVWTGQKKSCINTEGAPDECAETYEDETEPEDVTEEKFIVEKINEQYRIIFPYTSDTTKAMFDDVQIVHQYNFPTVNSFAIVTKEGLKGAYTEQGVRIAEPRYDKIRILDMDSYKALRNKKWGVVSYDGNVILPFEYDSITKVPESFIIGNGQKNDHFIVSKKNRFGVVNSKHETVLKTVFEEILIPEACACPTEYVIKLNGLYGLTDQNGKIIIPPKYQHIEPFSSSITTKVRTTGNKEGYINRAGVEFFMD